MAKKATAKNAKARIARASVSEPPVPVRISRAGVVLDRVAKVMMGQDVTWIAQNGGGPWTVTFNTSPFNQSQYNVPKGSTVTTKGGANGPAGKVYQYAVSNGQTTDQADVIVV